VKEIMVAEIRADARGDGSVLVRRFVEAGYWRTFRAILHDMDMFSNRSGKMRKVLVNGNFHSGYL
jgi:hypothetical protein